MTYKQIASQVSGRLQIPQKQVIAVYRAYWQTIKDMIQQLPLKEDLSDEQFNQLKTNFNIPSIGKLHCTYDEYKKKTKRYNTLKNAKD